MSLENHCAEVSCCGRTSATSLYEASEQPKHTSAPKPAFHFLSLCALF